MNLTFFAFSIINFVSANPLNLQQRSADEYNEFLDGMMFVGKRSPSPGFWDDSKMANLINGNNLFGAL
ncbi:Oidioi.mRNA.OKI2018_I69.chr2.g4009.t1.cds [Oikopleura dioica]|uniref:Oidioi.mRNA.OKI2018_I69.chr2.g4009.t1.cds n=1 Tax=Oikopleura dioica TaxID=34765 RepID=A0ABN7SVM0_OIKDI|nr:Oidioi.mRNA.OKI2018_I69.chr2.g4009.t1.cds [Oikopleura dioica]